MKILILTKEDIQKVFTMADSIQADKDALEIYSAGGANVPLRVTIPVDDKGNVSQYMPAYAAGAGAVGIKIVSNFPRNAGTGVPVIPATVVLVSEKTGEIAAMMDGTYVTRVRTGAVSGAATDVLARKDSSVFALFGTGGQAETQLEAVLTVRPIKEVRICDINPAFIEAFIARTAHLAKKFGVCMRAAKDAADAITGADIITTVTTSLTPVFDGSLLRPGMHVNAVGSYLPEITEIDEKTVTTADRLYVDTRDGVLNEVGDYMIPLNKGLIKEADIAELGEVIAGTRTGRTSDTEITVFKTVGSGVLDVVNAKRIYERALEKGLGSYIDL